MCDLDVELGSSTWTRCMLLSAGQAAVQTQVTCVYLFTRAETLSLLQSSIKTFISVRKIRDR